MKFLADAMLGTLARWLRMMGHDVVYSVKLGDNELLQIAKTEGRVLLTRDFELYKRAISRGLESFFVEGKTESDRLAEVAGRFGLALEIDMDKAYCPSATPPSNPPQKKNSKTNWSPTHTVTTTILELPQLRPNLLARRTLETNHKNTNTSTTEKGH